MKNSKRSTINSKLLAMSACLINLTNASAQVGRYQIDYYDDAVAVGGGSWVIGVAIAAIIYYFGAKETRRIVLIITGILTAVLVGAAGIGMLVNDKRKNTQKIQEPQVIKQSQIEENCVIGNTCWLTMDNGRLRCSLGSAPESHKDMIFAATATDVFGIRFAIRMPKSADSESAKRLIEQNKVDVVRLCLE